MFRLKYLTLIFSAMLSSQVLAVEEHNAEPKIPQVLTDSINQKLNQDHEVRISQHEKDNRDKICREYFNSDSFLRVTHDNAVSFVISNFLKSVYSYYTDQLSIRENIEKAYAYVLSATPAVAKLNEFFLIRSKAKTFHYQKVDVVEIKKINEADLEYEAHLKVTGKDIKELSDYVDLEKLVPSDLYVKIHLIKSPIINNNYNISENSDIILVDNKRSKNPFSLWVEDFSIITKK